MTDLKNTEAGMMPSVNKYSSGVPFTGDVAEIKPPEQQIQQMIDVLAPLIQQMIDVLVPVIKSCADEISRVWDAILKSYPNSRVIWLAFHHKKAKVRKKNRNRIIKHYFH